jgi:AraC-like DNA-binding protein
MTRRSAALADLPGTDVLSDVISALQLQGRVFCRLEASGAWAFTMPSDGLARFHVIQGGTCWAGTPDGARRRLAGGDLLVTFGEHHLSDRAHPTRVSPIGEFVAAAGQGTPSAVRGDGEGPTVRMLCGSFTFGPRPEHALLRALPPLLHVEGHDGHAPEWLDLTLRFLSAEVREPGVGTEAVVSRLTGLIFVQAVRAWVASQGDDRTGWVAALRDRQLAVVLGLMHQHPDRPWTVPMLAREVGLSRATLTRRFRELLGETPLAYLSRWRLQAAADLIRSERLSLGEVAARVGYQSEASFSRVFRQAMGQRPGAYRRTASHPNRNAPGSHTRGSPSSSAGPAGSSWASAAARGGTACSPPARSASCP